MTILTNFKKIVMLLIFSMVFSATALSQSSFACLNCTTNDTTKPYDVADFTMQQYYYYSYPSNIMGYQSENMWRSQLAASDTKVAFLKFNIKALKTDYAAGKQINSAKLNLIGTGNGSLSLFYVAKDSFVNENSYIEKKTPDFINSLLSDKFITINTNVTNGKIEFNFNQDFIDFLKSNVSSDTDKYFSLALKSNGPEFIINSRDDEVDDCNGKPKLEVGYGPTPTPEPSSMILGLMSIGSMLGFRRKKA